MSTSSRNGSEATYRHRESRYFLLNGLDQKDTEALGSPRIKLSGSPISNRRSLSSSFRAVRVAKICSSDFFSTCVMAFNAFCYRRCALRLNAKLRCDAIRVLTTCAASRQRQLVPYLYIEGCWSLRLARIVLDTQLNFCIKTELVLITTK